MRDQRPTACGFATPPRRLDGRNDYSGGIIQRNSYQLLSPAGRNGNRGQTVLFSPREIEVCNVIEDAGTKRPLVLVIDAETDVLEEVNKVLTAAEFECCCCTTADEAIAAAELNPPDLIICDLNLHGEAAAETCRRIKRQPGLEQVPVMFLSAAQRPDIIRRSHATGDGAYCLRKPFAPKVLVELIDHALALWRGKRPRWLDSLADFPICRRRLPSPIFRVWQHNRRRESPPTVARLLPLDGRVQ